MDLNISWYKNENVQVFLGGSCNPTTWRKEIAIPELKRLNISYYNPQIDDWRVELIELENRAKKSAQILLFVIDKKTRNTSSIIEIMELAATRAKSLVVVFNGFYDFNGILTGQTISPDEFYSLNNAVLILHYFLGKFNIPVFHNLTEAISNIPKLLNSKLKHQNRSPNSKSAVKLMSTENRNRFTLIKMHKSNFKVKGKQCKAVSKVINWNLEDKTTEFFLSEVKKSMEDSRISEAVLADCLSTLKLPKRRMKVEFFRRDLYVGVDKAQVENHFKNIKVYQQEIDELTADNLPGELRKIQNSKVVLVSVPKDSGGLGVSQLAAYLVAKRDENQQLVLSVENVDAGSLARSLGLSGNVADAVKDYNRGREYLRDFAERNGVAVFRDVDAALQHTFRIFSTCFSGEKVRMTFTVL